MPSMRIAPTFSITPRTLLALALWIAAFAVHLCAWRLASATQPDPKIAAASSRSPPSTSASNIEKLVSFGTRLTLSAQDPAAVASGRGIGAAREWIRSEFERYSRNAAAALK